MDEDQEMIIALNRLHIMHERALRTSVASPLTPERERDFRHALTDFVHALGLDPDTTAMLRRAAMNPSIPQGDAIWDD